MPSAAFWRGCSRARPRKKLADRLSIHLWTGGVSAPPEYTDLRLCRDVYHCTPSELDAQDARTIALHIAFMNVEEKVAQRKRRRRKR